MQNTSTYSTRTIFTTFVFLFYFISLFVVDNWKWTMNNGDSSGYYIHAVSGLINQDIGDYSKTLESFVKEYPNASYLLDDPFWLRETEIGRKAIKYPVGVAIMEIPALLVGHVIAKLHPKYDANGWSSPYIFCINLIQILYVTIAFFLLFTVLSHYFKINNSLLALSAIALGSNLFIQATFLTMAHTFQFFNFSLLIFLTFRFYQEASWKKAIAIGMTVGLIGICRIPELSAIVIPIFWGVYNRETFNSRIRFISKNYGYFIISGIALLLMISPQLLYWKHVSGQFIYNSYAGESINFLKPHIFKGWFSFKNGWLVYTPLMFLSLIGIVFLKKKAPAVLLPLLLFVGINTYVHYSYYQWNYFPGIGSRPMIDNYPLLAFSLAAYISWSFRSKIMSSITGVLILIFIGLNLFQTWQSRQGIIWTERSNRAFFWETFGKLTPSKASLLAFDINEPQPDESKISFVKKIYLNDFELLNYKNSSQKFSFSGEQSLYINEEYPDSARSFNFGDNDIQPGDYLKLSLMAYVEAQDFSSNMDVLGKMVLRIFNDQNKQVRWRGIPIQRHIKNDKFSIWEMGQPDIWDDLAFYCRVPSNSNKDWRAEILFWSPTQKLYVDDLTLEIFRKNR